MSLRRRLRLETWWAAHNLLAHPLSQILWMASLFGAVRPLARLSGWVHDVTVPAHEPHEGNG